MISTLKDISNKIAKPVTDALVDITVVAGELNLPFFVVGLLPEISSLAHCSMFAQIGLRLTLI